MLKQSFIALALAGLVARSGFPLWLRDSLVAPPLPTSYASLSLSSIPSARPIESLRIDATKAVWGPSTLKHCEDALEWDVGGSGRKLVLLSCDPGRREWNTVMGPMDDPQPKGQFWVIDPSSDAPEGSPVGLKMFPTTTSDFHPLGMDVFKHPTLGDLLYVVNHQRGRSTIELFTLTQANSKSLRVIALYLTTLEHPSFTGTPNAIAVLSPTAFYLSHDHLFSRRSSGFLPSLLNKLETIAALPLSKIDLVEISEDPKSNPAVQVFTVATGLAFPNGLALSHSRKTLAVASTTHRKINFYDVDPFTNSLAFRESVKLPFLVDNLSLAPRTWSALGEDDDDEDVFIAAGHPHFFSLAAEAAGKVLRKGDTHPSSWVVAVKPRATSANETDAKKKEDDLDTVYPASKRAERSGKWELKSLFQSSGGPAEGAFGMSTTGVGGVTEDGRRWMVVVGLYAEGAKLLRET